MLTVKAGESSFRTSKNIAECLADKLIACPQENNSSYPIRKKEEIERAISTKKKFWLLWLGF